MSRCRLAVLVSVVLFVASVGPIGAQFLPEIGATASMLGRAGAHKVILHSDGNILPI